MIKITCILSLIFFLNSVSYSFNQHFKIMVLGSLGYTAGGNVNPGGGSLLNYRFSLQSFYEVNRIRNLKFSLGLDLGYLHAYTTSYQDSDHPKGRSAYGSASFLHSLFMLDFFLYKSLFGFQLGLGPYFGVGDNTDVRFGFTLGPSLHLPLSKQLAVPIFIRFDVILAEHTLIPVNVFLGLSYQFF